MDLVVRHHHQHLQRRHAQPQRQGGGPPPPMPPPAPMQQLQQRLERMSSHREALQLLVEALGAAASRPGVREGAQEASRGNPPPRALLVAFGLERHVQQQPQPQQQSLRERLPQQALQEATAARGPGQGGSRECSLGSLGSEQRLEQGATRGSCSNAQQVGRPARLPARLGARLR
jgi:hypothetical protein